MTNCSVRQLSQPSPGQIFCRGESCAQGCSLASKYSRRRKVGTVLGQKFAHTLRDKCAQTPPGLLNNRMNSPTVLVRSRVAFAGVTLFNTTTIPTICKHRIEAIASGYSFSALLPVHCIWLPPQCTYSYSLILLRLADIHDRR